MHISIFRYVFALITPLLVPIPFPNPKYLKWFTMWLLITSDKVLGCEIGREERKERKSVR